MTITALREVAGMTKTAPAAGEEGGKGFKVVVKEVTIDSDGAAKLEIK